MTAFFEITVTFAALLAMCGFAAVKLRLQPGMCPLAVLCAGMLWYSVLGCMDLLTPAGVLWFAAAAGAAVWLVRHRKAARPYRSLFTPSVVFFLAASLVVIVLFAVRQPLFMEWDEFSFWGIAPKVVKTTGRLYTFEPGELRVTTYAPGLIMLDHMFQFLGSTFVPWKVFAAYDILLFAVFAAGLAMLERRHWHIAVPAAAVLVLLPFLLTVYQRGIYVQTLYMSSYADVPMGLLFGAPMALYYAADKKTPAALGAAALAIFAVCMSKEMGFALALIAAAILCFDVLFLQKKDAVALGRFCGVPVKIGWCVVFAAAAVVPYIAWAQYRAAVFGGGATELGGDQNMDMFTMLFTGLRELVGIGRTERFARVMGQMWKAFYSTSLSMFRVGELFAESGPARYLNGSGAIVVAVILGLLALAWWYAGKGHRARIGWFALWSTLGFAAFYIFTGFTYIYVFHEWQEMTNYNRYIYPYYLGWMLVAVCLLAGSLRGARGKVIGAGALTALMLFSCWRTVSFVRPQLSLVDYPESYFAGRRRGIEAIEQAKTVLTSEDKVFYVAMGDDGKGWFVSYYEFYPDVMLDYSFGGGSLAVVSDGQAEDGEAFTYAVPGILAMPKSFTDEQDAYFTTHGLSPEVLCEYLEASGCTALYLDEIDDVFRAAYGHLFADGLAGGYRVYRIEGGAQDMTFVPVPEGGTLG